MEWPSEAARAKRRVIYRRKRGEQKAHTEKTEEHGPRRAQRLSREGLERGRGCRNRGRKESRPSQEREQQSREGVIKNPRAGVKGQTETGTPAGPLVTGRWA